MKKMYDVIVVGAGFAGLAAGLQLKKFNVHFAVLEARNRVGGRTETRWVYDDLQIDLGGQWFGPTQERAYDLIAQYALETFPTQLFGKGQYFFNDTVNDKLSNDMIEILKKVDCLANEINLEEPTNSEEIHWQDRVTLHSWLTLQSDDAETVKMLGRILAGGLLGADAGEVSLFQILFYVKSGSGVDILLGAAGGAQQDRLVGGPHKLADAMANDISEHIYSNAEVSKISKNKDDSYTVTLKNGETATAKKVLLTVPPVALNKTIEFSPELPKLKRQMFERILPGSVLKYHAIYDRPFWREQGMSGQVNTSNGLIMEAVDNSIPGNKHGVITFFVYGTDVTTLGRMSEYERKTALLENLAVLYGDEARNVQDLIVQDWAVQDYTYGCFSGHFVPGSFIQFGDLRDKNVDGLYFAGTETSNTWNGYIDGAIRSGEREVAKIIKVL